MEPLQDKNELAGTLLNDAESLDSEGAFVTVDESHQDGIMASPGALLFSPKVHQLFYQDTYGKSGTFRGSIANLVNSAIGAGILALPFAFQQSGLVLALFLVLFFCPVITFTLHVMGRAQKLANKGSLQAVCEHLASIQHTSKRPNKLLGHRAKVGVIIMQLIFIGGACIGFLIIVADNIEPQFKEWFGQDSFISKREIVILLGLIPIGAMSFIKNIQKISPLATFSVVAIIYTLGMIVYRSAYELSSKGFPSMVVGESSCSACAVNQTECVTNGDGKLYKAECYDTSSIRFSWSVLKAIPVFCFAFNVHSTHSLVFAEMAAPKTLTKMDWVSSISLGFCAFVYVTCGIMGYLYAETLRFENGVVPGNILKVFPSDAIDVAIARLCIATSVVGSFTTLNFSAYHCLQDLIARPGLDSGKPEFTTMQTVVAKFMFIAICAGVALSVTELDLVIDITGAIAIIPITFIVPGLLQLKLHTLVNQNQDIPFFSFKSRWWGWFLVALGSILSFASLFVIVFEKAGVIDT